MPSAARARVVEEVWLRKGTPAAKYLKLVCSEIGAIIGRPQANESFQGLIEGYDVQASSKSRSTAETKT